MTFIEGAGRYTLAEAQKICEQANVCVDDDENPNEIVTPSPELIAMFTQQQETQTNG